MHPVGCVWRPADAVALLPVMLCCAAGCTSRANAKRIQKGPPSRSACKDKQAHTRLPAGECICIKFALMQDNNTMVIYTLSFHMSLWTLTFATNQAFTAYM